MHTLKNFTEFTELIEPTNILQSELQNSFDVISSCDPKLVQSSVEEISPHNKEEVSLLTSVPFERVIAVVLDELSNDCTSENCTNLTTLT